MKIYNGKIILPDKIIFGTVEIKNKKISAITEGNPAIVSGDDINANGNYISPGFIDIHTHGAGGSDFMDATVDAYLTAANTHLQHGATTIFPTTLASDLSELENTFEVYKEAKKLNEAGAGFGGFHLEGPYFSLSQSGAQDPKYIKNPDKEEYTHILSLTDDIKRWSAAPELKGALEFGSFMREHGILPSIAHTDANYRQVLSAYECGFTHITHFYSCMSGVHRVDGYRQPGVIESGYLLDNLTVEIIADGKHLPPELLKLIYKIKGADNIALVTDSMRAAGTNAQKSILGSLTKGREVIIDDNVAKMPDKKAFAGSVATADKCVENMIKLADVPIVSAVKMMTKTPARIMKMMNTGSIEVGYDADIIVFDDDIKVKVAVKNGILK